MVSMSFKARGSDKMLGYFQANSKTPIKYIEALDLELAKSLLRAKGLTHVITGRLKASARSSSDWDGVANIWTGEIKFGGKEFGVDYAIFEQDRRIAWSWRHGAVVNHDFMAPVYESEINFEKVMLSNRLNSSL